MIINTNSKWMRVMHWALYLVGYRIIIVVQIINKDIN